MLKKNSLLFLDYETYYDDEYSLRKMPIPNYLLDPRYETIMCAVKEDMEPAYIVDGPDFPKFIAQYDPHTTTTVAFNALFDNAILAWHYGFIPGRMIDTMGMARALRGHKLKHGSSLASVAKTMGFAEKGGTIAKVKGFRRTDIKEAGLWDEFSAYAMHDDELNAAIFYNLIREFPGAERRIMDLVLRCAVEPTFRIDTAMLTDHIKNVKAEKDDLLLEIGRQSDGEYFFLTPETKEVLIRRLQSSTLFRAELEKLGVEIDLKMSPGGNMIPAFAKTDDFMHELLEHEDPRVQALAAARLGHKSTIEETRAEKLLSIAELPWACYRDGTPRLYSGGTMPIPLAYGKAHTHRLSGEWGMNMQNLPTGRGSKGKSRLRDSLVAPPGHKVLVCDLGQIEARLVAWICGCEKLLTQFRDKKDPYAFLATQIFGFVVDRKIHIAEGFIGKTGILGLGYGCGVEKFNTMVTKMARAMGIDISKVWFRDTAAKTVGIYREVYQEIPAGWRKLDYAIEVALMGGATYKFGPVTISYGKVEGPGGLCLNYDDLQIDENGERTFAYGKFRHKIYGAKLLENIVQFLARIVVMNAGLRIDDRGYRFKLQAHDELVFIVPDAEIDKASEIVHSEMVRSPSWAPDLPLTADVGVGLSYGAAK